MREILLGLLALLFIRIIRAHPGYPSSIFGKRPVYLKPFLAGRFEGYQKIHCNKRKMANETAAQKTGLLNRGRSPSRGISVQP